MEFVFLVGFALTLVVASKKPKYNAVIEELKMRISLIDHKFQNINMYENGETYAHNKKDIYICLKDKNGKYYDFNTLTYVALHELAHIVTRGESSDHDEKFLQNFNDLLRRAEKVGIWNRRIEMPKIYCNVKH